MPLSHAPATTPVEAEEHMAPSTPRVVVDGTAGIVEL